METGFAGFEDPYGYYTGNPSSAFILGKPSSDVQEKQVRGFQAFAIPGYLLLTWAFCFSPERKKYYERWWWVRLTSTKLQKPPEDFWAVFDQVFCCYFKIPLESKSLFPRNPALSEACPRRAALWSASCYARRSSFHGVVSKVIFLKI